MKFKKWFLGLFVMVASLLFVGCESGTMGSYVEVPSSRDLKELIYTYEMKPEGVYLTYDLFMSSFDCHLFVYSNEGDASYRLSEKAFTEILDVIDEYNMQSWSTMTENMIALDGVEYSLTMRDFVEDKLAESGSMPENGQEAFRKIEEIVKKYMAEGEKEEAQKVTIGGKEYELQIGTDIVVYGDDNWWEVEGYVGHFEVTDMTKKLDALLGTVSDQCDYAEIDITSDGSVTLTVDGETYKETCSDVRHYNAMASAGRIDLNLTYTDDEVPVLFVQIVPKPESDEDALQLYMERK